jgi:serine/threonine protein phosphatase PrpC
MRSYAAIRPFPGQVECGDAAASWQENAYIFAAIADGLGHGPEASLASRAFFSVVQAMRGAELELRFREADQAMRGTRGAAAAMVRIDAHSGQLVFAGIGNIRGGLVGSRVRLLEGAPGIVGNGLRSVNPIPLPFSSGDLLALWTDGLDRVDLGIVRDPALRECSEKAARALLAAFGRSTDDCAVLCVRLETADDLDMARAP